MSISILLSKFGHFWLQKIKDSKGKILNLGDVSVATSIFYTWCKGWTNKKKGSATVLVFSLMFNISMWSGCMYKHPCKQ